MFYGRTLNNVAQAALVSEPTPVVRKAVLPARQGPSQFIASTALYQDKIAAKKASGALKSAFAISRDLQRSGKIAPNTEGATQLLLSRLQKGKVKSSAIPAILRLPEAEAYSQVRPQALQAASKVPSRILKQIALLKKILKLKRRQLRLQASASQQGQESAARLIGAQVADASAQAVALETQIIAEAAGAGLGDQIDTLVRSAELEATLEEAAESSLGVSDADLMEAGSENEDVAIMDDVESGIYLEQAAANASDAAPLFSDDDSSALIEGPSSLMSVITKPRNLLVLAAATGLGYVLFFRD